MCVCVCVCSARLVTQVVHTAAPTALLCVRGFLSGMEACISMPLPHLPAASPTLLAHTLPPMLAPPPIFGLFSTTA